MGEREYRYFKKEGVSFEEDEDIVDLDAIADVPRLKQTLLSEH